MCVCVFALWLQKANSAVGHPEVFMTIFITDSLNGLRPPEWNILQAIVSKMVIVKMCVLQQFAIKSVFMEADVYFPMCVLAALDILE